MKVTGTGNPASLTLRLREREVAGLKEELGHQAAVADDAGRERPDEPMAATGRRPGEILPAVLKLLDELTLTAEPNEQGRVVVVGPTWLLGPAIRGATTEAAEQLVSVLRRFPSAESATAEELRDAGAAASAWSETLIGYEHVQSYGLTS
jgi:hypothetical protein